MNLKVLGFAVILFTNMSQADAIKNIYSRGNDDVRQKNYETARCTVGLNVFENSEIELSYNALLTAVGDSAVEIGMNYFLNERNSTFGSSLKKVKLLFTPGPGGKELNGHFDGQLTLGTIAEDGGYFGTVDVSMTPEAPGPNSYVAHTIEWALYKKDGMIIRSSVILKPNPLFAVSMLKPHEQKRHPDGLLRLVSSNYLPLEGLQLSFPPK